MLTPRHGEARHRPPRRLVGVHPPRRGADAIEIASAVVVRDGPKRMLPFLPAHGVTVADFREPGLKSTVCVMCCVGGTQTEPVRDREVGSEVEINLADQGDVSLLGV